MSKNLPTAKKKLGQHFLNDKNIIQKICTDYSIHSDAIIEIGPGPGILTESLQQNGKTFHVIEKDHEMDEYLFKYLKKEQITIADALDINLTSFINEHFKDSKKIWLVSNLPYNVSVPLTINFIRCSNIQYMTLMFQKEVGEKIICDHYKQKNSTNSLQMITNNFFKTKLLSKVAPGAFLPPPKVASVVISFERIKSPQVSLEDFKKFESILRLIFSQKRKQLFPLLKKRFNEEKLDNIFKNIEIDRKIRAEALTYQKVIELYLMLSEL